MQKSMLVVLALAAGAALAQEPRERPNATDPKAKAPPVQYRSAFSDYRSFREPEAASWREVNDRVKALKGHQGHVPKKEDGK